MLLLQRTQLNVTASVLDTTTKANMTDMAPEVVALPTTGGLPDGRWQVRAKGARPQQHSRVNSVSVSPDTQPMRR